MQPKDYIEAGLWNTATKDGQGQYLKGQGTKPIYIEAGYYLPMVFANKSKQEDRHPDARLKLFPSKRHQEQSAQTTVSFEQDIPF